MEIVGHFGRLGKSDEYFNLSFNTFRDCVFNILDNASWARSGSDLLFLDVQMKVLRMMKSTMEKAEIGHLEWDLEIRNLDIAHS